MIRPALDAGKVVICDRFGDSTLAYQGYGHETNLEELGYLVNYATGGLKPDLTLLLDIPVKDGLQRKVDNDSEWNRLDAYAEAFHCRVRQGYLSLAAVEPDRWVIIDAAQSKELVQESIQQAVLDRLP